MGITTLGPTVTYNGQFPALQVAPLEAFAPELKCTVVGNLVEQVLTGLAAGVTGVTARASVQANEGILSIGRLVHEVVALSLDKEHLTGADEGQIANTRGVEHVELQVCAQMVNAISIGLGKSTSCMLLNIVVSLIVSFHARYSQVSGQTNVTEGLVNLCGITGIDAQAALGEEQRLAEVLIGDAVDELTADGTGTVLGVRSIVAIAAVLGTVAPVPVVLIGTAIATEDPLTGGTAETSCISIVVHQGITLLGQLSVVEGGLIILLVEGSTGINSVCTIQVRSPAVIGRTVNTTLVEQRDSLIKVSINLSINLGHG